MNKYYRIYITFLAIFFLFSMYSFISLTVIVSPNKVTKNDGVKSQETQIMSMPVEPTSASSSEASDPATSKTNVVSDDRLVQTRAKSLTKTFDAQSFMDSAVQLQVENDGHVFHNDADDDENNIPFELEQEEELIQQPLPPPRPHIFWPEVQYMKPNSVSQDNHEFRSRFERVGVASTVPATFHHCGRPTNAQCTLADGSLVCIRHRQKHNHYVVGEVLSKELATLLHLDNVPAAFISTVAPESKWRANITALQWAPNEPVTVIQWVPEAKHWTNLPQEIIDALLTGRPIQWKDVANMTDAKIRSLSQFSDLIIFDYITGHYDRIAAVQDEADKQANKSLLHARVSNLLADDHGSYWFIDNEAGLLDAYMLIYQGGFRFKTFHQQMLNTICLFRKETVFAANHLYQHEDPLDVLIQTALQNQPLLEMTNFRNHKSYELLRTYFNERLTDVIAHLKECSEIGESK